MNATAAHFVHGSMRDSPQELRSRRRCRARFTELVGIGIEVIVAVMELKRWAAAMAV